MHLVYMCECVCVGGGGGGCRIEGWRVRNCNCISSNRLSSMMILACCALAGMKTRWYVLLYYCHLSPGSQLFLPHHVSSVRHKRLLIVPTCSLLLLPSPPEHMQTHNLPHTKLRSGGSTLQHMQTRTLTTYHMPGINTS